jgi:UDP-N-acetylglucosamine/UDP-N-acetylgalactosamine diphosphorylase
VSQFQLKIDMTKFEELKSKLEKFGQQDLVRFWDQLTDDQRQELINDVNEINLAEVKSFFQRATSSLEESGEKLDDRLKAVPESKYMSIARTDRKQLKSYEEEGAFYNYFLLTLPRYN